MIERLSFGSRASGSSPSSESACEVGIGRPRRVTSRSPNRAAARYESGVRSPLAY